MTGRIRTGIEYLILLAQAGLALLTGYLLVLSAASLRAARKTKRSHNQPANRFLIIIPAHNEALLLGDTLDSLAQLQYPHSLYAVYVIADNCTDRTAEIAAQKGAVVSVRTNHERIGKGYALQWLLGNIWREGVAHDALLFLDADSIVSPNFLSVMDARLSRGEKVIQAYYAVREPEKSWNGALRYAALAVLHYLRPQGRMVLGGSAGLKGNGMVFAADVMKQYTWPASLTEDIELHMSLILCGQRVTFAPDAIVWGEMPDTFSKMESQHMRWEQGRLQMARKYVPVLVKQSQRELAAGKKEQAFVLFDAAMEHLIPPFSVLVGLTTASIGAGLALKASNRKTREADVKPLKPIKGKPGELPLFIGIGLLLAQAAYLLVGLRQVRASRSIYIKLLYAPILILWKLKQYIGALFSKQELRWTRTERNGGQNGSKQFETQSAEQPEPDLRELVNL